MTPTQSHSEHGQLHLEEPLGTPPYIADLLREMSDNSHQTVSGISSPYTADLAGGMRECGNGPLSSQYSLQEVFDIRHEFPNEQSKLYENTGFRANGFTVFDTTQPSMTHHLPPSASGYLDDEFLLPHGIIATAVDHRSGQFNQYQMGPVESIHTAVRGFEWDTTSDLPSSGDLHVDAPNSLDRPVMTFVAYEALVQMDGSVLLPTQPLTLELGFPDSASRQSQPPEVSSYSTYPSPEGPSKSALVQFTRPTPVKRKRAIGPAHSLISTSLGSSSGKDASQQDLTHDSMCHADTMISAAVPPSWGSGILWCDACDRSGALDNVYQKLFIWLMRQLGCDNEDRKWRIFQKEYRVSKKSGVGVIIAGANNRHAVASFITLCCYACYIQHDCSCSNVKKMKANGFEGNRLPRRTINQCYETIRRIDDSKWKRLSKEDLPPTSEQRRNRACNDLSRYSPAESMSMQTMGFNRSIPSGGLLTDTFVDCRSLSLGRKGSRDDTDTSLACPPLCSPRFVLPKPSVMVRCTAETMRSGSLALSVSCRPSTCCAVKSPKRRAG
jgi:hypothetical protein